MILRKENQPTARERRTSSVQEDAQAHHANLVSVEEKVPLNVPRPVLCRQRSQLADEKVLHNVPGSYSTYPIKYKLIGDGATVSRMNQGYVALQDTLPIQRGPSIYSFCPYAAPT